MQTALTKALEDGRRKFLTPTLNEWDKHEQTIRQPQKEKATMYSTGNISRDTFNFVRDNNGKYIQSAVVNAVIKLNAGYKKNSVSSVVTQCKRAGTFVQQPDGTLFATASEYVPLRNVYGSKKSKAKAKAKPILQGLAALAADTAAAAAPRAESAWDADTVLANMGIKEAHRLYLELAKYFGGAR
jgi:hypothetical protein